MMVNFQLISPYFCLSRRMHDIQRLCAVSRAAKWAKTLSNAHAPAQVVFFSDVLAVSRASFKSVMLAKIELAFQ